MSWYEKGQKTSFDELEGAFFLDGAMLGWLFGGIADLKDKKFPQIVFPSGQTFDIWAGHVIHVFQYGEMDLNYHATRDEGYEHANDIAEQCGYIVRKVGTTQLEAWGHEEDDHYLLTYDDEKRQIADIKRIEETTPERPQLPAHDLLPDEIREMLPPLYANEEVGLMAMVVVKYFTPDAGWTWYASEFDGDDLFFGLVVGQFIELGYFALSELKEVRGGLGLPIERDLHFEPKSLKELKEWHEKNQ